MTLRTGRLVDAALLALTCALVLDLTRAYVSAERAFYFWDFGVHQDLARETAEAFQRSSEAGLEFVGGTLDKSYNALFAVPLVPLLAWWGSSRVAYEQALALVCFLPLPLSVGALAARLARNHRRAAFWTAAGLTLLTPLAWIPTLRGFPDSLPAALVGLALLTLLSDPHIDRARTAWAAGALLAMATVLRRHFAYAVLAFGALLALLALLRAAHSPRPARWVQARRSAAGLGLLAASGLTVAGLMAPGFLRRALAYDHRLLQQGYVTPLAGQLQYSLQGYGLALAGLGVVGLWLGLRSQRLDQRALATVAAFGALQGLQWLLLVRQVGEQYTLHLTPPLVLCAWALAWSRPTAAGRGAAALFVGLIAASNLWLGLTPHDPWRASPGRALAAGNWPPSRHPGYASVLDLVQALRSSRSSTQPVFVAASSFCLNADIVRRADAELAGASGRRLDVQDVPAVDSEGAYPIGLLIDAGLVVVGEPLQLHLPPERQQVVRLAVEALARRSGLALDFEPWPQAVSLGACQARVFERRRPTRLAVALAALDEMRGSMAGRPGQQPDWAVVESPYGSWLERLPDGAARWIAHPTRWHEEGATRLASLEPAAGRVTGRLRFLDARCPGVTLDLAAVGPGASLRPLSRASRRPGDEPSFVLESDTGPRQRLALALRAYSAEAPIHYCLLAVEELALQPPAQAAAPGEPSRP